MESKLLTVGSFGVLLLLSSVLAVAEPQGIANDQPFLAGEELVVTLVADGGKPVRSASDNPVAVVFPMTGFSAPTDAAPVMSIPEERVGVMRIQQDGRQTIENGEIGSKLVVRAADHDRLAISVVTITVTQWATGADQRQYAAKTSRNAEVIYARVPAQGARNIVWLAGDPRRRGVMVVRSALPGRVEAAPPVAQAEPKGLALPVRPRPKVQNVRAAVLANQPLSASEAGAIGVSSRLSESGVWWDEFISRVDAQFQKLAGEMQTRPPARSSVMVRFMVNAQGAVRIVNVEGEESSGRLATYTCLDAIASARPYRPWTQEMMNRFGAEQEVTTRFFFW